MKGIGSDTSYYNEIKDILQSIQQDLDLEKKNSQELWKSYRKNKLSSIPQSNEISISEGVSSTQHLISPTQHPHTDTSSPETRRNGNLKSEESTPAQDESLPEEKRKLRSDSKGLETEIEIRCISPKYKKLDGKNNFEIKEVSVRLSKDKEEKMEHCLLEVLENALESSLNSGEHVYSERQQHTSIHNSFQNSLIFTGNTLRSEEPSNLGGSKAKLFGGASYIKHSQEPDSTNGSFLREPENKGEEEMSEIKIINSKKKVIFKAKINSFDENFIEKGDLSDRSNRYRNENKDLDLDIDRYRYRNRNKMGNKESCKYGCVYGRKRNMTSSPNAKFFTVNKGDKLLKAYAHRHKQCSATTAQSPVTYHQNYYNNKKLCKHSPSKNHHFLNTLVFISFLIIFSTFF